MPYRSHQLSGADDNAFSTYATAKSVNHDTKLLGKPASKPAPAASGFVTNTLPQPPPRPTAPDSTLPSCMLRPRRDNMSSGPQALRPRPADEIAQGPAEAVNAVQGTYSAKGLKGRSGECRQLATPGLLKEIPTQKMHSVKDTFPTHCLVDTDIPDGCYLPGPAERWRGLSNGGTRNRNLSQLWVPERPHAMQSSARPGMGGPPKERPMTAQWRRNHGNPAAMRSLGRPLYDEDVGAAHVSKAPLQADPRQPFPAWSKQKPGVIRGAWSRNTKPAPDYVYDTVLNPRKLPPNLSSRPVAKRSEGEGEVYMSVYQSEMTNRKLMPEYGRLRPNQATGYGTESRRAAFPSGLQADATVAATRAERPAHPSVQRMAPAEPRTTLCRVECP